MICCSIQTLKLIAEEVAREQRDDLQVTAVLPGEARGAYAEVLLVLRRGAAATHLLIGVARDMSEAAIRQSFAANLRAAL
jgi:hypothetical protein